jgi:hypothetical protein
MSTNLVKNLEPFGSRLRAGLCPTCGGEVVSFRDELSAREYAISGMCQGCQDSVFCDDDEDDDGWFDPLDY